MAINIINKKDCCGCNACGDVCSHNAIVFKTDMEGFWYPEVDKEKCTDCGLCEAVCPIINVKDLKKNDLEQPVCYAAKHKNLEVVFDSTSGGLFSALAEKMYRDGGYVGGAIYDDNLEVKHYISNQKSDLPALRSSKYVESDLSGFYKEVKRLLKNGEKVLVCGCPCQMAALRAFLKKDYDNLLIADFICRGINSPLVGEKFGESLGKKYGSKLVWVKSKNKELGWRNLTAKYRFADGQNIYVTKDESLFTRGYLHTNAFCRPSCYDCRFKGFPRISDITLADFWGIEHVNPSMDDNLGTSLVLVNSEKGRAYYEAIQQKIRSVPVPFESMMAGNPALIKPLDAPRVDRDVFFSDLQNHDFDTVANKYFPFVQSKKQRLKQFLKGYRSMLSTMQYRIGPAFRFIKYNFFRKNIQANHSNRGYLIPAPYSIIQIGKTAKVKLNAAFTLGHKKFRKSKLETRFLVEDGASLIVNSQFNIGYGSDVEIFRGGKLEIKGESGVNRVGGTNIGFTLVCSDSIEIGEGCQIGRNVTIRDNNGNHYLSQQGYKTSRPVVIGKHVWLCEGCTIMSGVKIGDGAIIGAGSLVMTNIPPFSLASGNPAKVVQTDIYWKY